eukprot:3575077-Rhodomonas_salina.1
MSSPLIHIDSKCTDQRAHNFQICTDSRCSTSLSFDPAPIALDTGTSPAPGACRTLLCVLARQSHPALPISPTFSTSSSSRPPPPVPVSPPIPSMT